MATVHEFNIVELLEAFYKASSSAAFLNGLVGNFHKQGFIFVRVSPFFCLVQPIPGKHYAENSSGVSIGRKAISNLNFDNKNQ